MSLKTQAKVLSALDDQIFTPVGGAQPLRVDVRLIASTNKDLEEGDRQGQLPRRPLLPPQRRSASSCRRCASASRTFRCWRASSWPSSAASTAAHASRSATKPSKTLAAYHWPGNVRELKNVIERVLILNPRALRIERKHLPPLTQKSGARSTEEFSSLQQARDAYEREYILKKIEEARNNISHAAELLGLERSHLYRKMKALGISVRE